jgi:hypothetical protein
MPTQNGWSVYNPSTGKYEWSAVSKGGSSVPNYGPAPGSTSPLAPTASAPAASGPTGQTSWANNINFDAILGQQRANSQAESVADLASRNAAINRDFVRAGFGLGDLSGLDPSLKNVIQQSSIESASNNPYSIAKRIEQAYKDQLTANRVSLRQRGGVRSGEQGYLAQKALTGSETAKYDSLNSLLDAILGYNNSYVNSERTRQQGSYESMLNALMRQLELMGNVQQGTTQAPTPQAPVYATANSPGVPVSWIPKYQPGAPDVMIRPGWTRGN